MLKFFVILSGLASFLIALALLSLGTSLFADFRTENIMGPGVDVILLDKYPTGTEPIRMEVIARGGKKAGLNYAMAFYNGEIVGTSEGDGMDWGDMISGKGRGDEQVIIYVDPKKFNDANSYKFELEVNYVWAKSSGAASFSNATETSIISIDIPKYEEGEVTSAKLADLSISIGFLALHFIFWYVLIYSAALREKKGGAVDAANADEVTSYALFGNYMALCIIGYWIFALPIAKTFNIDSSLFTIFNTIVWCAIPILVYVIVKKRTGAIL
ncbi:MAG: hypothetical protein QNK23_06310 [Crocinitomicaceae bacterium]|nr:hypothetical protein [Crocinitomicaceae bacterium]